MGIQELENSYNYNQSHFFNVGYAQEFGVNEAIMISNFIYIISYHRDNNTHIHDGKTWSYNSVRALTNRFPYWTIKQIRSTLDKLVDKNVLVKSNFNKTTYDRTSWYAFVDETKFIGKSSIENHEDSHLPKKANGCAQKGEPIPLESLSVSISKEKYKKEKIIKEKKPKREVRVMKYMEEGFIVPDEWITWVVGEYGCNEQYARDQAIRFVNYYVSSDKKYCDWRRTWQNWISRNKDYPDQAHHFNQLSQNPSQSPTEAPKEKIEYRTREGVDKIICDEIKRLHGDSIFSVWIENNNVSFYQEKDGGRVECKVPTPFTRDWITNNILIDLRHLDYKFDATVDPTLVPPTKDSSKKPHWLDLKMQAIAKKHSKKAYELMIKYNIRFSQTPRKGMLEMSGCTADVWDQVYNILNPIAQDFHDLKIAIGRPN